MQTIEFTDASDERKRVGLSIIHYAAVSPQSRERSGGGETKSLFCIQIGIAMQAPCCLIQWNKVVRGCDGGFV